MNVLNSSLTTLLRSQRQLIMCNASLETHFDQNGVLNSTDKKASQPYLNKRETPIPKCLLNFGSN